MWHQFYLIVIASDRIILKIQESSALPESRPIRPSWQRALTLTCSPGSPSSAGEESSPVVQPASSRTTLRTAAEPASKVTEAEATSPHWTGATKTQKQLEAAKVQISFWFNQQNGQGSREGKVFSCYVFLCVLISDSICFIFFIDHHCAGPQVPSSCWRASSRVFLPRR